jgi:hypothetical protein
MNILMTVIALIRRQVRVNGGISLLVAQFTVHGPVGSSEGIVRFLMIEIGGLKCSVSQGVTVLAAAIVKLFSVRRFVTVLASFIGQSPLKGSFVAIVAGHLLMLPLQRIGCLVMGKSMRVPRARPGMTVFALFVKIRSMGIRMTVQAGVMFDGYKLPVGVTGLAIDTFVLARQHIIHAFRGTVIK